MMGSSGGRNDDPSPLYQMAAPMQGLPIAGKDSTIGSPYEYGQFQSFLPDIPAEGPAPMATGLTPEMLKFKSPSGVTAPSTETLNINSLRDQLAELQAQQANPFAAMFGSKAQFRG